MKRVVKILVVFIVIVILIMISIPLLFKSQIVDLVKQEANKNINATINFSDVGLNLFTSFPNLALSLSDLTVVNKAPFEGDTLLVTPELNLTIDLFSAISGDVIEVNTISLVEPKLLLFKLKDGTANYKIIAEDSNADLVTKESSDSKSLSVNIDSYNVVNGKVAFINQTNGVTVVVNGLTHSGTGELENGILLLDTKSFAEEFTIEMDGMKFLNKVSAEMDLLLDINLSENKLLFKENQVRFNNLILNLEGGVEFIEEEMLMDFRFNSPKANFKDFLSLVPTIYQNNFEKLTADGGVEINGKFKGQFSETTVPAFDFNINIDKASFSYSDLPQKIRNVNLDLSIDNPDGNLDNTIVDIRKLHFEVDKEPFDAVLKLRNMNSKPFVNAKLKGVINLDNFSNSIALENITKLSGIINTDISFNGILESTNNNYESLDASGKIQIKNFEFKSKDFAEGIKISRSTLNFTPKKVELSEFSSTIGESDISVNGDLTNFISFALSDATLQGRLNVTSNYFNLNPFLSEKENVENSKRDKDVVTAVDIPENINIVLSSSINKLVYDNLDINNFKGLLIVKESKISMESLSMNLLNGNLTGSGYYLKKSDQENPEIKFNLNVANFNIKQTYDKFVSVKQFAPIANYIQGSFSSSLSLTTNLNNEMIPDWNSFYSNGQLSSSLVEVRDFKPLTTVGNLLNLSEISNPKIQNINPKFKIENGKFILSPLNFKIDNYDITLSGSNSIDQTIDYVMEIDIPSSSIRANANSTVSKLLKNDVNLIKSDKIKIKALIGGTIYSPVIKTSATDVAKDIASEVVEEVKEQIVEEVKSKIDTVKSQVETKIKDEVKKKEEELKKKLEEDAKKKLKKIFKFG